MARSIAPVVVVVGLAACSAKPADNPPIPDDIKEVHALVSAIRHHPSLVDSAKFAGPPIHVNPYSKSAGNAHHAMRGAAPLKTRA